MTLVAVGLTTACADDGPAAVCEPACAPYGPWLPGVGECVAGNCTPTFMECFENTEFSTCQAQCEAVGSTCAENGCADGTYMIHSNLEDCTNPEMIIGGVISRRCDEGIDWQVNTAARCCCEQDP
ncbi:hypothetical protein [Enhygromyxa salina]|uniref:hypothetical protein n=1 Tax=Enhygromyxa salina TaxID=215803 RepID=UPI0011BAA7A0|nr:hypothetical protein [Enhygromyxa salina]